MITHNLTVHKNSDMSFSLEIKNDDDSPMDLSGYGVKFISRKSNRNSAEMVLEVDGEIVDNTITISLKHNITKDVQTHIGHYNVVLQDDEQDVKYRLLEGKIVFTESLDNED